MIMLLQTESAASSLKLLRLVILKEASAKRLLDKGGESPNLVQLSTDPRTAEQIWYGHSPDTVIGECEATITLDSAAVVPDSL